MAALGLWALGEAGCDCLAGEVVETGAVPKVCPGRALLCPRALRGGHPAVPG